MGDGTGRLPTSAAGRLLDRDGHQRADSDGVARGRRRREGAGCQIPLRRTRNGDGATRSGQRAVFMLGPLSGLTPGETRYAPITKSPLTGAFLDSYGGGRFPRRLAGSLGAHMGILLTGRSDEPVVLEVDDGEGRLEPASERWRRDAGSRRPGRPRLAGGIRQRLMWTVVRRYRRPPSRFADRR